jgi:UTP--glucose-1-phosphate uridylyltransferase
MSALRAGVARMRAEGLPEPAIRGFASRFRRFVAGDLGVMPDAELEPVRDVVDAARLPQARGLEGTVIVKLNGGLGTSMGLRGPKSLIEAKDGRTFLDIIDRQARALGRPLVLMNSFATRDVRPAGAETFLQHRQPKLRADDLTPVCWPRDPALEWCPPGHGDLYHAMMASGMLDALLDRGLRYAFISNADNLGATLDPAILAWFAAEGLELAMEVVAGTEADRKGGHIALRNGRLVLRETAQAPDEASFRDFRRWRFYNTNNLWLDLEALAERGPPDLPLIVNRKTVDPTNPDSPAVLQLETAMGAAIGAFERVAAVRVPRSRFVPVKTTNDLLVLRSDVYALADDGRLEAVAPPPFVDLDPEHFGSLADFERRFPDGPPSLAGCERFVVHGSASFAA